MPTIKHSLNEVIASLDAKIAELQAQSAKVPGDHPVLKDINARITSAQAARKLLFDSCCTVQSCDFTY